MNLVERARLIEKEDEWNEILEEAIVQTGQSFAIRSLATPYIKVLLEAQLATALWTVVEDIEERMQSATDLTDYGRGYHNALRDVYLGWTTQFEVAELKKPERKEDDAKN